MADVIWQRFQNAVTFYSIERIAPNLVQLCYLFAQTSQKIIFDKNKMAAKMADVTLQKIQNAVTFYSIM